MTNCTYISLALLLNDMHIFEECIRSSLGTSSLLVVLISHQCFLSPPPNPTIGLF